MLKFLKSLAIRRGITPPFVRYSDRSRRAVQSANSVALSRQHEFIQVNDLLLGIILLGESVGTVVLRSCGVDLQSLRHTLHPLPIDESVYAPKLPLHPESHQIIDLALVESNSLEDDYVGTEHLCLSMSRSETDAGKLLNSNGATHLALQVATLLCHANSWENAGDFVKARKKHELALKIAPTDPMANGEFAWMLSTCRHAGFRDGSRAVILAEKACSLTDFKRASCLDSLAAAYAETGQFEDAIRCETKAIAMALPDRQIECTERLTLYRQQLPYRWIPKHSEETKQS